MIEYIKGVLINKKPGEVIVESGGIAYCIHITLTAYESLPHAGNEVRIITHFHLRDNPMQVMLYGFSDETERDCFRQIISVSGIGPKTALTILSAINYREFIEMISKGDYVPLTSVSGVGRKTAERLSVELKDKINKAGGMTDKAFRTTAGSASNRAYEVISALISLGYNRAEAEKMARNVIRPDDTGERSIEDVIKEILRGK